MRADKAHQPPDNSLAWAAHALPGRFFPAGLGDAVRKLASLCDYPGRRARYHACYYDLRENVDYNYLSVPSCEGGMGALKGLTPIEVEAYDDLGKRTGRKRTMPITMRLTGFPQRTLLLRQFVDWCLLRREDMKKALTTCSASCSAG